MPLRDTAAKCLSALGRALKENCSAGEQFCVFAFDCDTMDDDLIPEPAEISKQDLPFTDFDTNPNWTAAFYNVTSPNHTEKAVLDTIEEWMSRYEAVYGQVNSLYIYSRLIPCFRDGCRGMCSEEISKFLLGKVAQGRELAVYIGWGNDDRDPEMASATKTALADLADEDGISIEIFNKISIAGSE